MPIHQLTNESGANRTALAIMTFLFRIDFLAGIQRSKVLWRQVPLWKVLISPRRPSFTGDGKTGGDNYGKTYIIFGTTLKGIKINNMNNFTGGGGGIRIITHPYEIRLC